MKIGLLIAFAGRRCGGPEIFEREIVRAMLAVKPEHEYHLYCLDRRAADVMGIPAGRVVYHLLGPSARPVSMLTSLPLAMSRNRTHVFHAPIIPPVFCPANTIMAMPCSSLIRRPEFYPPLVRLRLRFLLHRAIARASRVICASEHVRDVMQERFGLASERFRVVYPGVSGSFRPIGEAKKRAYVEEKYNIRDPYFLVSGRWERRKNIVRTLEAFALFKRTWQTGHKLVFTGGRSWGSREADEAIGREKLRNLIVDLGKTDVDELPYLYGAAEAVVYASLWEGFGMPIVEAMACGTPVITSNVAAMPETAGGNAVLVNPDSTEEIAAAMHRVVTQSEGERNRTRDRGLDRAKLFTWERAARKTLELYDEVANSGA